MAGKQQDGKDMTDREVRFTITKAIREGDIIRLEHIFALYPDMLHAKLAVGQSTWLHYACGKGEMQVVLYLISQGIDINEKDERGERTALSLACGSGHLEIVRYLLEHGATISIEKSITNPLFDCVPGYVMDRHPVHGNDTLPEDYFKIAELLLDCGIDYNVCYNTETMSNMDAMAFACMWGRQDIARLIADRKAGGDLAEIELLLAAAEEVAGENTEPVPEGEVVRPS